MWKCSNCDQTSSRRWNLETHIKRKHDGLGEPINLEHGAKELNSMSQAPLDSWYQRSQYQSGIKTKPFQRPFARPKRSLTESVGPINEIYDLVHKFAKVKEFMSQNSGSRNQSLFSWTLLPHPQTGLPFPSFAQDQFPGFSFHPNKDPFKDCIIGYRGHVCESCLTKYVMPVYRFEETGKIVRVEHRCDSKVLPRMDMLPGGLIPGFINDLFQMLLQDLKNVVNQWTKHRPCLVSELLPVQRNSINLKISKNNRNDWARRAIRDGQTTLSDPELIDFLCLSGNQTYNCFNAYFEEEGYTQGPFRMSISKQ
jgi:hypothetical protein